MNNLVAEKVINKVDSSPNPETHFQGPDPEQHCVPVRGQSAESSARMGGAFQARAAAHWLGDVLVYCL